MALVWLIAESVTIIGIAKRAAMNKEDEVSRLNRLEGMVTDILKNELVEDGLIPFDENVHVHFPSLVDQVVGIIRDESLITLDEAQWYGEWCADQDRGFLISNDRETIWKKWEAERDEYKQQ